LCAEYGLIHCVDPFEAESVHGEMRYWRLHGRGSYSYRYTDGDLAVLHKMLTEQPSAGYLMFNNFSSKADALRFRQSFRPRVPSLPVADSHLPKSSAHKIDLKD
jgi:uncharacterized protein YecE (DUF72 family)